MSEFRTSIATAMAFEFVVVIAVCIGAAFIFNLASIAEVVAELGQ
jgi:hypothetical protein